MNKEKIKKKRIFEILHCPFEGWAKLHHLCQPNGPVGRCLLGGNSKDQCTISKILFPLLFVYISRTKYIFSRDMFCLPHFWAIIHGVVKHLRIIGFFLNVSLMCEICSNLEKPSLYICLVFSQVSYMYLGSRGEDPFVKHHPTRLFVICKVENSLKGSSWSERQVSGLTRPSSLGGMVR